MRRPGIDNAHRRASRRHRRALPRLWRTEGNTLLYLVLVMVVLGLLGAAMVSMFTSATVSTAVADEDQQVRYLLESAVRYAASEMRNSDFSKTRIEELAAVTRTMPGVGSFDLDIYSLWYRAAENKQVAAGGFFDAAMDEGELPAESLSEISAALAAGDIHAVNLESTADDGSGNILIPDPNTTGSTAVLSALVQTAPQSYRLTVADDFAVSRNERVCLAVHPLGDQSVGAGGTLNLPENARLLFPASGGVAFIRTGQVTYREAVHLAGQRLELRGLSSAVNVAADDYVVLTPGNHVVIPTAATEHVTLGGTAAFAVAVADTGKLTVGKHGSPEPDVDKQDFVENLAEKEEAGKDTFIKPDTFDNTLVMGEAAAPTFGGAWYDADKSVGGVTNFCDTGRCRFGSGIRAFFTFTWAGSAGEGFVFALPNALENDAASIGGDIAASELLGYAGDSRLRTNPEAFPDADDNFLDGNRGRGLQAPKIGLEFDARVNYSAAFEAGLDWCSGDNLVTDTRNDPLSGGKDAVQLVYWGADNVNVPCRADPVDGSQGTYDDNRHDATDSADAQWNNSLGGYTGASPAVAADGTIYVGAPDRLWAFAPDGSVEWEFAVAGVDFYSPAVGADGTVYAGASNGVLYAIHPDGTQKWATAAVAGRLTTRPAIGAAAVYAGADDTTAANDDRVYAFDIAGGAQLWQSADVIRSSGIETSSPALSPDGTALYIGGNNGLHALSTADGTQSWKFTAGDVTTTPAVAADGTVYFGSDDDNLYALNPDGTPKWMFDITIDGPAGDFEGSPAVGPDGTIYFGGDNTVFSALNPDGTRKWFFNGASQDIDSTPVLDLGGGTVYFAADDDNLYALSTADGSELFRLDLGSETDTRLAIGPDGAVYAATGNGRLHAVAAFAEPRNYRQNAAGREDKLVAYNAAAANDPYFFSIENSDDWFKHSSLPWAVRLEVNRAAGGDYTLRAWVHQCQQADCGKILGTFFENTRVAYEPSNKPPQLVQAFTLGSTEHQALADFLFGFTTAAAAGDDQVVTIGNFQLSFIRPNDVVRTDPFDPFD